MQERKVNILFKFVYRLCESEIEHSAALSGAVTALRHDEEARLSSKVENVKQQEKVFVMIITYDIASMSISIIFLYVGAI